MTDRSFFGRIPDPDPRDAQYPLKVARTARTWRYWWQQGWWGDQGATPRCVEYAWWHVLMDGPATQVDHDVLRRRTPWLYCEAQSRDGWEGDCDDPKYDGTSVRAGAKALSAHGMLTEYRWAQSVDDLVRCVLTTGPLVVGSRWPDGFMQPQSGFVSYSESGSAGHAYKIDGVNTGRGVARIKNSWGRGWGDLGRAWVTLDDLAKLFAEDWTEACYPVGI